MNNNKNQNGKESDIITKKGFLISLPGKKNGDNSKESSIHMSNVKDSNESNNSGKTNNKNGTNNFISGKKFRDDRKNPDNSHNKENKDRKNNFNQGGLGQGKSGKNKDRFRREKSAKEEQRQIGVLGENVQKNENKPVGNGEKGPDKALQDKAASENQHGRDNRHDRRNKHSKKFKSDRKNTEDRNDKNLSFRNDKHDWSDKANNKHIGEKNRENDKKIPPLSALSAEITAYSPKHEQHTKNEDVFVKEPTLEEKYKDAKPLAQQIAEQEMRSKGIKVPTDEEQPQETVEIVGVRFREAGKIYYFDPNGKSIPFGTPVIVETARGSEYGYVAISNRFVPCNSLTSPLKQIERIATEMDTQKHIANRELEAHAEGVFKEKVEKLGLEMNLIYVEYTFDNSRLLFYFTAETRIDFRELVKELAGVFRTRIELRQIGVRDEAKAIGGIGVCGRANCCNTFLGDFAQVSIKMAKDQSLSLNASKISGACGKLMCCLRYEDRVYEEENARTPKVGSIVETPDGKGHVVERNALKGTVKVALDLSPEAAAQPYSREDVKVIGFNKQKSGEENIDENLDELKDAEE